MGSPDEDKPQNRGYTGVETLAPYRNQAGQFPPGTSGNPGGRPSTKWIRDWLSDLTKEGGKVRRVHLVEALFLTAIDRRHKDHVRAGELLLAYEAGKPIQAVEVSGPEGAGVGIEGMTSEQQEARLRHLIDKVVAGAASDLEEAAAAGGTNDGGSGSQER